MNDVVLAIYSDRLFMAAVGVYVLAMVLHAAEYAAPRRPGPRRLAVGAAGGGRRRRPCRGRARRTTSRARGRPAAGPTGSVAAAANLVVLAALLQLGVDRHPRAGRRPLAAGQHVRVHLGGLPRRGRRPGSSCCAASRRCGAVGAVRAAAGGDPAVPGRHGPLRPSAPVVPALRSYWLVVHVTTITIVVGAAARPGRREPALPAAPVRRRGRRAGCDRLPSAAALDRLAYRTTIVAFPLYTFGVIAGAIWAEAAWGRFWGWDPKETVAFVAWVVYAAYLHARATAGWRSGRAAWINVAGLGGRALQLVLHQHGRRRPALVRRALTGSAVRLAVRDHRPPSSPSTERDDATTVGFRAEQGAGHEEQGHGGGPIVTRASPIRSTPTGPSGATCESSGPRTRRRAVPAAGRPRRLPAPAAGREPQHATPVSGLEVVPPPDTDLGLGVSESRAAGPDIVRPDAAGSPVVPRHGVPAPRCPRPAASTTSRL